MLAGPAGRTVLTHGLDPNDAAATVYVMWGLGAGAPQPLGVFDVTAPGPSVHEMPGGDQPFTAYAVSLEPGRSMPASPTDVVASGPVRA
ncbi:hypothetical protein BJF78_08140 [Pseudonocardia sp. CNS-139]|nr:hypothetical protein BJF78_08140 [Pseudonocardia sp. CNS-139]